ncbi:MAG: hypothetical protein ABR980_03290 [Ignavibacteriaceae bacterium]|jgi:hypothetical protein
MNRNKLLPSLVCGFGAAVLTTVPGVKNFACCLIVPVAAVISISLDHKINRSEFPIKAKQAILFGIMTGVFAALFSTFFDALTTYLVHSNDFIEALPQTEDFIKQYKLDYLLNQTMTIFNQMASDIRANGFSAFYSFGILMSNLFVDIIFGMIGGLAGMSFFNKRTTKI